METIEAIENTIKLVAKAEENNVPKEEIKTIASEVGRVQWNARTEEYTFTITYEIGGNFSGLPMNKLSDSIKQALFTYKNVHQPTAQEA